MSAGRAQFVRHLNNTKIHKTGVFVFEKGFLKLMFAAIGTTAPSIESVYPSTDFHALEASS